MRSGVLLACLLCLAPAAAGEPAPAPRPVWRDYALVAGAEGHASLARCVAFAPDGRTFATGGSDRSLRIWDAGTGKALSVELLPRSG